MGAEQVLACLLTAALPHLSAPEPLFCGSRPLVVEYHSSPFFGDWTGDGLADLMVGQFEDGMVRFCANTGTTTDPVWESCGWLEADGEPISVPYG